MIVTLWGTRGSLAGSGPDTKRYGGNTSCVQVHGAHNTELILDAGTGIRRLGRKIERKTKRVDILLTHLHLDHIQGLGFFTPLFDSGYEVHIYGPAKNDRSLITLLTKYLSPPLFPVLLRDLPCQLYLHAVRLNKRFEVGEFSVIAQKVCHPGITVGYRISDKNSTMTYLPDHEPALGVENFPLVPEWTSGYKLAKDADLLLHDAQYTQGEYEQRIGWGHSSVPQALQFARLTKVKTLVTFHHDPSHSDDELDEILENALSENPIDCHIEPGLEGRVFKLK